MNDILSTCLHSCAKPTIVEYLPYFLQGKSENEIKQIMKPKYRNERSFKTEFNCLRRIYQNNLSKSALQSIIERDRVDTATKLKAQSILSTL